MSKLGTLSEVVELERRRVGPGEQLDELLAAHRRHELPVAGSGRIAIVPPVETTTTAAAGPAYFGELAAARRRCRPASSPSSSSTRRTGALAEAQADDGHEHERVGPARRRRAGPERVEVGKDRPVNVQVPIRIGSVWISEPLTSRIERS